MLKNKNFEVNEAKDGIISGLRNSCIVLINTGCSIYQLARLFECFIYPLLLVFRYDDELRGFLLAFRDELMNRFVYLNSIDTDRFTDIFNQVVEDIKNNF